MKNILIASIMVLCAAGFVNADLQDTGEYDRTQATLSAGYNRVETEDNSGRAAEYMYQDDSGTAAFRVSSVVEEKNFVVEGDYRNENDFTFNGFFNHGTEHRLELRIEKMFHNLDHIDYVNRADAVPDVTPAFGPRAVFSDVNPDDEYSLKVSTYEVKMRSKLPDMPAHVSVGYWQFRKEGEKQLRFVDENCAAACHLQSKTREIDRTTHQVTGSFDAHLGKFDVILEHLYREQVIDNTFETDFFEDHNRLRPGSGNYQHSENPETQLSESTLKVHSSLAGGLVLAASGTYGKRTNNSVVTGAAPISAETEYWKGAADITHVTSPKFSYYFKTRYLDTDASNTAPELMDPFTSGGTELVAVRPPIDLQRATYELISSYKPGKNLRYKLDLKVEHLKRSETGPDVAFSSSDLVDPGGDPNAIDPVWELPEEELISTAKLGFFARPENLKGVKFNGYYKYRNSDDPAYGASLEDSHQVFLSTNYSPGQSWGIIGSANALIESRKDSVVSYASRNRDKENHNINLGLWYNPHQNVTTSLNYGYNRIFIEQDLVIGLSPGYIIDIEEADYLQQVHTVSGSLNVALTDSLKTRLNAYYTRSLAFYDPEFVSTTSFSYFGGAATGFATSDQLKQISQFDIDQYGVKAGVDYYFTPDFEFVLEYSYNDYDEKYSDIFDGSVQTATANLAYRF